MSDLLGASTYHVSMHVLIIEDHRDLAANMVDYLQARGHVADAAGDGITGLHLAVTTNPDVIVLDLGLPGLGGMELCRRLREEGISTPLVMLTARCEVDDRVVGLLSGADDYLIKPVALRELEARLLAQLRRARGGLEYPRLQVADLVVDDRTKQVTRAGREIELARMDYLLLFILVRASPAVVSRAQLESALWGDDPPGNDVLRVHVHRVRRAVDHPCKKALIHTVHGVGYRVADLDAPAG